ncbi:3-phosphoshikimate 1-carboxyvinyltransferase [Algoriphagus sediminis]|uniref:3-phosphoshikimate 1-carboxyvinyltransferase n=1 Tax=Algoriphagus sediminis TaxID=3057113 RepID=A0ABT7Y883_9BACT|nr:3-phosphoshikimate 1-carboxyvinyltransferase [Algoriphagus sediminis]MDN3202678.1 3-phosphoshikimate 1-carboxyvinyltransferase [Algoriphagus sediminis]
MSDILLLQKEKFTFHKISLPASKSESNRALIIDALTKGENKLTNLAEARDTQTMIRLLREDGPVFDVLDAGTTMRFLTAYSAIAGKRKVLTGTDRMCQRPIGILVEALKELGASVHYLTEEGYPPLAVNGFPEQKTDKIVMRGDVSSQYISAILMVAPTLPNGLELELEGKIGSRTYIEMTLELMSNFGIKYKWIDRTISIKPQEYKATAFAVESDWSGASYWFSLLACAKEGSFFLEGLKENSLQGDSKIVEIMDSLGIKSEFKKEGVLLTKQEVSGLQEWDFTHCPDLAQTVAVTCAILGQNPKFTGLESLRIKETDRIYALQQELGKFGAKLIEKENEVFELIPSFSMPHRVTIETYDDHRMAMAFMPLLSKTDVEIRDLEVVNKSYPSFWKHCESIGIKTKITSHEV